MTMRILRYRNAIFTALLVAGVLALYGALALYNIYTPLIVCDGGAADVPARDGRMTLVAGDWLCRPGVLSPEEMRDGSAQIRDVMHMGDMEGHTYAISLSGEGLADLCVMLPRPRGSRLFIDGREVLPERGGLIASQDVFSLAAYMDAARAAHEFVLQVPVSGYFYSGYQGVVLGGRRELERIDEIRYMVEVMCLGLYLTLGLMCVSLFLQKRSERYILLLVLYTLVTAYRFMNYSEHFTGVLILEGYPDAFRLFFFLRYVLCRVFVPSGRRRVDDFAMITLTAVTTATFFFTPQWFVTVADKANFFAMILEGVLIVRGLAAKRQGTRILLAGWGVYTGMELFYRLLHCGFVAQGIVDVLIRPTQYAHVAYLIAFSSAIFGKFASKFSEAEAMTGLLEQKVGEQTRELREKSAHIIRVQEQRQKFLTDVVHNIRNPLFALGGYFELLEDELSAPTEQQRRYIDLINSKLSYVNRMVADMLLIDRLENDKISFHFVNVELSAFLRSVAAENKLAAQCEVTVECDPLSISADGHRLHQAVDNLLDNAVLHGQATKIAVSARTEDEKAVIEIRDNGRGMTQEQLSHAFERYATSGAKNSVGLGLSIVQEIIRQHHGTVTLESVVGQGTCARICLPAEHET